MASGKLTFREGKGFTRDLGWRLDPDGRRRQPRFLLGKDEAAAKLANLRLEQLWDKIVADTKARNAATALNVPKPDPAWSEEALTVAEAIRKGLPAVNVPYTPIENPVDGDGGPRGESAYAFHLHRLRQNYPMIAFMPMDPAALALGQTHHRDVAEHRVRQAKVNAAIANAPVPFGDGRTLHQAIDAYVDHVKLIKRRGGELTGWGSTLFRSVLRLKDAHPDSDLAAVDFNVVEKIKHYFASRPLTKLTGKPMALDSVRNHLKALRMFLKWLHRNPDFRWRLPDDVEQAWHCDVSRLMSDPEIAALKDQVKVFPIADLSTLYKYATDRERVLILLGLNCGFAQAECVSLRKDEITLDGPQPSIKRVRRKSKVYGEFVLWPQTVKALDWIMSQDDGGDLAIRSERGQPLSQPRIANYWNALLRRVRADHPEFCKLSFKFLRKTAAQLVREASDGEIAGVFLCHGQPVQSDDLSDRYSSRPFDRVATATAKVHERLAPMFAAAPADALTAPRKRGGLNITQGQVERIQRLHRDGLNPTAIARHLKIGRPTVYRHIPKTDDAPAADR